MSNSFVVIEFKLKRRKLNNLAMIRQLITTSPGRRCVGTLKCLKEGQRVKIEFDAMVTDDDKVYLHDIPNSTTYELKVGSRNKLCVTEVQ